MCINICKFVLMYNVLLCSYETFLLMKTIFTPIKGILSLILFLFINLSVSNANDDYWALVCPPDVNVDCDDELWDLSIYGDAYISTYGGNLPAGNPTVHYYLNACGSGHITRTWMAEDPYWNWISCTQTIWVGSGGNFGYNNIEWPKDTLLLGCDPYTHPNATGYPSWTYVDCSMIGTSYSDMVFTVNDGCRKIMRTWKLMDWCSTGGSYQTWTHRQFIKIANNEVPQFDCPADITASSNNCKNANVTAIPLYIDPSTCGGHYTITNSSPYSYAKGADISGVYPVGTTKVGLTVKFGCGMKRSCWINVIVKNNKPPSPICLSQVNIALMGLDTDKDGINDQGMVDIWAKDLDWKSTSNCGFYPLQFSFSADSLEMFKRFTCDDLGLNTVNMYVSDSYGNQSYCVVRIDVQNNGAKITPCVRKVVVPQDTTTISSLYISGRVNYFNDKPLEKVEMTLINMESETKYVSTFDTTVVMTKDSFINYSGVVLYFFERDTVIVETIDTVTTQNEEYYSMSDTDGLFSFEDMVKLDKSFMLKCGSYDQNLEGIDKKDLDALTEFIIGTRMFKSAKEYLAADINDDGIVNLLDLSLLIDYIKGDITSFGDNDWVLYLENEKIRVNPELALTERNDWYQIDSIKESITDLIFKAVQRGDIIEEKGNLNNKNKSELRSAENLLNGKYISEVTAYPNPFSSVVNLTIMSQNKGTAQIKIFGVTGKELIYKIKEVEPGTSQFQISLNDIPESMIFYQVTLNGDIHTGKLSRIN